MRERGASHYFPRTLMSIGQEIKRLIAAGPARRVWSALNRGGISVFTFHRFQDPKLGNEGHDLAELERFLRGLHQAGLARLSLREAVNRVMAGEIVPQGAVVLTVDDGYLDFASVAAPLFAKYGCPVTVFLTTGFVDGQLWQWWDRVEYLLERYQGPNWEWNVPGTSLVLDFSDYAARRVSIARLIMTLKELSTAELLEQIDALSVRVGVVLPEAPLERYRALSWQDVERLEGQGVRFAPHTISHPVLSREESDVRAEQEISLSWRKLCGQVRYPVPVFCYPNGKRADFGKREVRVLRALGLDAAVTTIPGYLSPGALKADELFALPRFSYPEDAMSALLTASGFTGARQRMRNLVLTEPEPESAEELYPLPAVYERP